MPFDIAIDSLIPYQMLDFQWKGITFVTAEIVGPTHSGVHLSALKNGTFLWAKLELKPEGEFSCYLNERQNKFYWEV